MLEANKDGRAKNNRHNCKVILQHDPLLKGAFRYNIFAEQTDVVKPLWRRKNSPAFNDMDMNYLMLYLEENYGITIDKVVQKSVDHEADRNQYHPVRDYLNGLAWDGQERIRYVLHHFLGAPVDDLTYESMKMFLMGAISRVFHPGIKFEYMLCLVGGQGVGKSTFFRLLAVNDDWFTDDLRRLDDENVYRRMRGHWIIELSEMVATARSKSIEETKSFISRQKETYKDLYALYAMDRPRQCVFAGTSNNKRFLPFDRTGNRRFVPVQNRGQMEVHILEDEAASRAYLEQVWAEAMVIYRSGDFRLAFSKEIEARLDRLRLEYMSEDTDAGIIQEWLDKNEGRRVCSMMIHREALGNFNKPSRLETDHICEIMNTSVVGWAPGPTTRFPDYGTQRSWVCVNRHCKREAEKNASDDGWQKISDEDAGQMALPF
ncbi:MAG: virulence-associated E family protein [Lachnospiraceae bacterium]|nr:virulence-associated E family protein [Lachnospiraceae bacterium]